MQRTWAVEKPIPPLMAIAKQAGFSEQSFNACLSDQKMLDAMQAEQKRATDKFKVSSTPTLFINGKMQKGGISIDDLAKVIDPLLEDLSLGPRITGPRPVQIGRVSAPFACRENRLATGQYCTVVIWPYSIDFHSFFPPSRATEAGISRAFRLLYRGRRHILRANAVPLLRSYRRWALRGNGADAAGGRGGGANRA